MPQTARLNRRLAGKRFASNESVMKNGQVVGTGRVQDMTKDQVLGMIILGKCPPGAIPGPGAMALAG
jgi:D-xylose transport system ATP-binding protein